MFRPDSYTPPGDFPTHRHVAPRRRASACGRPRLRLNWNHAAGWLAGLGLSATVCAQAPRLAVEEVRPDALRLSASGVAATNLNLQGSFDLETWFTVASATPVDGRATFALTNREPVSQQFFRAVIGPPPPEYQVGPQLDPSRAAAGVITPEAGGELELTDADGVSYRLLVSSNRVWEPVAIRMTLITNFAALPFTNRFRAAVAFEPEGLEFRGAAELRIRFPQPIPELEMVGYGFNAAGGEFGLKPWAVQGQEVVLALAHFSGAGVVAEPFPASGNWARRYEQALKTLRDGERYADQVAAEALRDAARAHQEGRTTREEFEREAKEVSGLRDRLAFKLGIQPLLEAAQSDCEVGRLVLRRLDQLQSRRTPYWDGGPYAREILRLYPGLRCRCAHEYLERCERDPHASGIGLARELTGLLQDLQIITGFTGEQACDLGTDAEILARMQRAACHRAWEGMIRYQREDTEVWTSGLPGFQIVNDSRRTMTYVGRVTDVLKEDGDPDPEFNWQSWKLRLEGKLSASLNSSVVTTSEAPTWRITDTEELHGYFNQAAPGVLDLRFEQGQPDTAIASAGLEGVNYEMPIQRTTERAVQCWDPNPAICPKSQPRETKPYGTDLLHFAFGSLRDAREVRWNNGELKIVFEKTTRNPLSPPGPVGYTERRERMTLQLWRGLR
jgi:hypothetical protein